MLLCNVCTLRSHRKCNKAKIKILYSVFNGYCAGKLMCVTGANMGKNGEYEKYVPLEYLNMFSLQPVPFIY